MPDISDVPQLEDRPQLDDGPDWDPPVPDDLADDAVSDDESEFNDLCEDMRANILKGVEAKKWTQI